MPSTVEIKEKWIQKPLCCPQCGTELPSATGHKKVGDELHSIARCDTDSCNHKQVVTRFARYDFSRPETEKTVVRRTWGIIIFSLPPKPEIVA